MKTKLTQQDHEIVKGELLRSIRTLNSALGLLLLVLGLLAWQYFRKTSGADAHSVNAPLVMHAALDPLAQKGQTLFKNNCGACHHKDMRTPLTGPALGGVQQRWAAYPRQDLYRWIRNSQALIQQKHPRALELWATWSPVIMNAYNDLSDEDIEAILAYVDVVAP